MKTVRFWGHEVQVTVMGMLRASVDNVLLADQPADYANTEIIYLVKFYSIKKRIVCFLINDL